MEVLVYEPMDGFRSPEDLKKLLCPEISKQFSLHRIDYDCEVCPFSALSCLNFRKLKEFSDGLKSLTVNAAKEQDKKHRFCIKTRNPKHI